jgi:hypothetical protein
VTGTLYRHIADYASDRERKIEMSDDHRTTGKMKNRILYLTRNIIPYSKDLQPLAQSVVGCILMQQLDYWFEHYSDGFYKFAEPSPGHPQYKTGESWCEELGLSIIEFRTAFDKIGIRYKSKSQFEQTEDKFQGKYYCSYFDRRENLTYYRRNHSLLDDALDMLIAANNTSTPSGGNQKDGNPSARSSVTQRIQRDFTVNRESSFPVNEESSFPFYRTEITYRKKQQQQITVSGNTTNVVQSVGAICCSSQQELIFPKSLMDEERNEIANILLTCPDASRQQVLDEIEGAICGNTIQIGVIPLCRGLVRAVKAGTFTSNLGVTVSAKRHAAARYAKLLSKPPTPTVTTDSLAASQAGAAILARAAEKARKKREIPDSSKTNSGWKPPPSGG